MNNSLVIVKWICFNGIERKRSHEERDVKRCLLLVAFARITLAQVPEIPYDSVPNFLKLPPDIYLGEVSGVAVNSKKHIFVFSRGNTTGPAYGATAAQLL